MGSGLVLEPVLGLVWPKERHLGLVLEPVLGLVWPKERHLGLEFPRAMHLGLVLEPVLGLVLELAQLEILKLGSRLLSHPHCLSL
jgi:hypothetical protein